MCLRTDEVTKFPISVPQTCARGQTCGDITVPSRWAGAISCRLLAPSLVRLVSLPGEGIKDPPSPNLNAALVLGYIFVATLLCHQTWAGIACSTSVCLLLIYSRSHSVHAASTRCSVRLPDALPSRSKRARLTADCFVYLTGYTVVVRSKSHLCLTW